MFIKSQTRKNRKITVISQILMTRIIVGKYRPKYLGAGDSPRRKRRFFCRKTLSRSRRNDGDGK